MSEWAVIKIMRYESAYVFQKRFKLVDYLQDHLNNYADGNWDIGSGMNSDLDLGRPMMMFVAWEHGKPIGWASVTFNPTKKGVGQVGCFVGSKHRRRGVGSRLIAKAKAWCKANRLTMRSNSWNEAGRSFYSSNDVPDIPVSWAYIDRRKNMPV